MFPKNEFNQLVGSEIPGWTVKERPQKINFEGRYCLIEPLDIKQHAAPLYESLLMDNQGESWTYLPYGPFKSFTEFEQWLSITLNEKDTLLYSIANNKNKHPIGIAGYLRINPEHGVLEIGHLHFSKLLQKTPIATEAMYLMMQYAFETLKYRRYEWKCNSLNEASKKAALRLGFKYEGTFRQSNVFKNHNRDTDWFAILDCEWPALKKRFINWLSPENFDSKGHQKIKL